jgi:hypothetical protein
MAVAERATAVVLRKARRVAAMGVDEVSIVRSSASPCPRPAPTQFVN